MASQVVSNFKNINIKQQITVFKKCQAFSWTGTKFYPEATDDNPFPKEYYKNTTCYFYETGKHIDKSSFKEHEGESISGIKSECLKEYKPKDPPKPSKIY